MTLDGVSAATTTPADRDGTTYKSAHVSAAGYAVSGKKIIKIAYQTPADEIFVTVTGLKSGVTLNDPNITVGDKKFTIKDAELLTNGATLSASNNYTLKLGSDVTAAVESSATLKNGKYTNAGVKTTGYKLVDNKNSYLTKNLKTITFSGLTSGAKVSDITVNGKKITLGKNVIPVDGTAVSVETSGYTLATDYVKTTGSDKKTCYVQKVAKFTKAYSEYGIKVRIVEGTTTTTYMAAASGKNLVLTAGKENFTASGAAKKNVEVTANGILYKAAAGLLTNTSTNAVTITENYNASKGYTASASIKSVTATKVKENIAINGSKAVQISITGGKGKELSFIEADDYRRGSTLYEQFVCKSDALIGN